MAHNYVHKNANCMCAPPPPQEELWHATVNMVNNDVYMHGKLLNMVVDEISD